MKAYRYKDSGITSGIKPYRFHLWIEVSSSLWYAVDSTNQLKLQKSVDEGENWSTVTTRDEKIQACWYERTSGYIWFVDCDNDIFSTHFDVWKITTDGNDTITGIGASAAHTTVYAHDIYYYDSHFYVFAEWTDTGTNYLVNAGVDAAPFGYDAEWTVLGRRETTYGVLVGDTMYWTCMVAGATSGTHILTYDTGTDTFTKKDNLAGNYFVDPSNYGTYLGQSYDGSDIINVVVKLNDDSKYYLVEYAITADDYTVMGEYNVALMLDRNNVASGVNPIERAFGTANEVIYSTKFRRGGIIPFQDISELSDANIIAITDNYAMNSDGDVFEYTDISDYFLHIYLINGIFPTKKTINCKLYPTYENLFTKGDAIEIYDDSNVLIFWGYLKSKTRSSNGIYNLKYEAFTNEQIDVSYVNSFAADESSTKIEYIITNGLGFSYYDSSITATVTTYDYVLRHKVSHIFNLIRFLERQIIYSDPDGKTYSKDYDGLVDSGETWTISDNDENTLWRDIPAVDEPAAGYFSHSLGITRADVRMSGNTVRTKPDNYADLELLAGMKPLREWRDPRLEANAEADQLADNLYNIFSSTTQYLCLQVQGKGYLQPGQTVNITSTNQFEITATDFMILSYVYNIKNDVYTELLFTDNIIFPSELLSFNSRTREDVETAVIESTTATSVGVEDAAYGAGWDGDAVHAPSQNAVYDTLSAHYADANAHHTSFVQADADALYEPLGVAMDDITDVTITGPADNDLLQYDNYSSQWVDRSLSEAGVSAVGHTHDDRYYTEGETDAAIDADIATHAADNDAHHTPYTDADTDAEVAVLCGAGQTIDNAIDALITAHTGGADPHTQYLRNDVDDATIGKLTVNGLIPDDDLTESCGDSTHTWLRVYSRDYYDAGNNQILGTDDAGKIDYVAEINANITMSAGKTIDTKDVSTLCTTAEAHAYVEANALTLENNLNMGNHDINGLKDVDDANTLTFEAETGDKISLYDDRIGLATMYGFGLEAGYTYYKGATGHRFYCAANADTGTSDVMEIDATQVDIETNLDVNGNITVSGTVDGQDVAAMAADLANQCTTAEAIAAVEAANLDFTGTITTADTITTGANIILGGDTGIQMDGTPADTKGYGMILNISTSGISAGEAVYIDAANSVEEAKADSISTMPCIGICIGSNQVLTHGTYRNDAVLALAGAGNPVYVSPSTEGVLTTTCPSGSGQIVQVVGIVLDTDMIFVNPSLDWVEIA